MNRLEDCFSIYFIQGTEELPSIVKIREKKDTKMLGGVRPVERLMEREKEKKEEEFLADACVGLSPLFPACSLWASPLFPCVPTARMELC